MARPTRALMANKMKPRTKQVLDDFFKKGKKVAGNGRFTSNLGKSESGPCKECQSKAGRHNIGRGGQTPPYHPNCKCTIT